MKNRIPPPIVVLFFGLCIFLSRDLLPKLRVDSFFYVGLGCQLVGIGIIVFSIRSFRKHETSLNPLKPDTASTLVVEGTYGFSRNPMYLGLAFILVGVAFQLNIIAGMIFVPLFVLYLNVFQIIPEEKAMLELFGDNFDEYKTRVRRWI